MEPPETYRRITGFANGGGQQLAINMSALLFLRGLNSGLDFLLGTNVYGAGVLDDIVFRFKPPGEYDNWTTVFVQLKHKVKSMVIRSMLLSDKGDFSIPKYFQSYLEIKNSMTHEGNCPLLNGSLEQSAFVIFTNAQASEFFRKNCNDILSGAEKFLWCGKGNVLSFEEDEYTLKYFSEWGDEGKAFLGRLRLFCNQPDSSGLKAAIRDELLRVNDDIIRGVHIGNLRENFLRKVWDWWETSNEILHNGSDLLRRAALSVKLDAASNATLHAFTLEIDLAEEALMDLRRTWTDDVAILWVKSSESSSRLTFTKVVRICERRSIFIAISLQRLMDHLEALELSWTGNENNTLIVFIKDIAHMNEQSSVELLKKICKMATSSDRRLSIVASCHPQDLLELPEIRFYEDSFDYSQIYKEWITDLKNIKLQGKKTLLTSLCFAKQEFLQLIDAPMAVELSIGNTSCRSLCLPLAGGDDDRVVDTIERRNVLQLSVFGECDPAEDVTVFVPSLEYVCGVILNSHALSLTSQEVETALCEHSTLDASNTEGQVFNLGSIKCQFVFINERLALRLWKEGQPEKSAPFRLLFVDKTRKEMSPKLHDSKRIFELRDGECDTAEDVTEFAHSLEYVRQVILDLHASSLTPQEVETALCEHSNEYPTLDASNTEGQVFNLGSNKCQFVFINEKLALRLWKERQPEKSASCRFLFVDKKREEISPKEYDSKHIFELRDGNFYWSSTTGRSMELVRKHLDRERVTLLCPEALLDISERVVVILAKDGDGKTFVERLASRTKTKFPSLWVVVIALTGHDELFERGLHKDPAAFLSAAAGCQPGLEETLLRVALEETDYVVVLVKCLKELNTEDEERYFEFLVGLKGTKVNKICVVVQAQGLQAKLEDSLKTVSLIKYH